jgi:hypothetical protein
MSASAEQTPTSMENGNGTARTDVAGEAARPASAPARNRVTPGLFRFSVTQFLVALILVLIANPFLSQFSHGEVIVSASMTLVLISAMLAVGEGRGLLVFTILLLLPALAGEWVDHYQPGLVPAWASTFVGLLFVGFVVAQLVRFIVRAPRVNADVLCAGISAYLLLGLLWAAAYLLLAKLTPDAFSQVNQASGTGPMDRSDALFFSFATLTCLGCNDIMPVSKVARMLMMMEATTGVLFLAVMIARLVALFSRPHPGQTR